MKRSTKWAWLVFVVVSVAFAVEEKFRVTLLEIPTIRANLGLSPTYDKLPNIGKVKIAVLDKGFGAEFEKFDPNLNYLPQSSKLLSVNDYLAFLEKQGEAYAKKWGLNVIPEADRKEGESIFVRGSDLTESAHGLRMAQMAWAAAGNLPEGPQFFLMNANTRVNLKRAIRYAIDELKVDIILYAQVYENGQFDGTGYTNEFVNQATGAGILWVQSGGNNGERVYNGLVESVNGYVQLGRPGERKDSLKLRARDGISNSTIVLSWNAYTNDQDAGTNKDLDIELRNSKGEILNESEGRLKQILYKETGLGTDETYIAQERLTAKFGDYKQQGDYELRIIDKSGNFDPKVDRLRITLVADTAPVMDPDLGRPRDLVVFLDNRTIGREIMTPADNPNVITVADFGSWSSQGPTMDDRQKPDIFMPIVKAEFLNNDAPLGTSGSAALFAGELCALKSIEPRLSRVDVLRLNHLAIQKNQTDENLPGRRFRLAMDAIHHAAGKRFNSVFQNVANDKMWEIELESMPQAVADHFPKFDFVKNKDLIPNVEFYLVELKEPLENDNTQFRKVVRGFTRRANEVNGKRAPYPWMVLGGKPSDYLRIRVGGEKLLDVTETPDIWNRQWHMPTLEQLADLYG